MTALRFLGLAGIGLALAMAPGRISAATPQAPAAPAAPTAQELAQILSVDMRWWDVALPKDMGPRDGVQLVFASAEGKPLETDAELPGPFPTGIVRIFCWEDRATHKTATCLQARDGGAGARLLSSRFPKDYFKQSGQVGPNLGSLIDAGDPLVTFTPANVTVKLDVVRHP